MKTKKLKTYVRPARQTNEELLAGLNLRDPQEVALSVFFFATDEMLYCENPKSILASPILHLLRSMAEESSKETPSIKKMLLLAERFSDAVECGWSAEEGAAAVRLRDFKQGLTRRAQ